MNVLELLKQDIKKIMVNDPAHDFEHIMRVYKTAQKICKKENANEKLVLSAVLLHDIISYPKSDFDENEITIISDAIRDHSFSQKKTPETIEGKILQDSDRLDALGAIGIARVFATGGSLKRPFYNIDDPFCKKRSPDDKTWTVDHFFQKLLKLESLMNTKSGKIEAKRRTRILKDYLKQLKQEV